MKIFEAVMLVCFGAAWPVSIFKSYTSRKTGGKSVLFLYIIAVGYVAGIIHKYINNPDYVLPLYFINLIMVLTDIGLWHRNRGLEKHGR